MRIAYLALCLSLTVSFVFAQESKMSQAKELLARHSRLVYSPRAFGLKSFETDRAWGANSARDDNKTIEVVGKPFGRAKMHDWKYQAGNAKKKPPLRYDVAEYKDGICTKWVEEDKMGELVNTSYGGHQYKTEMPWDFLAFHFKNWKLEMPMFNTSVSFLDLLENYEPLSIYPFGGGQILILNSHSEIEDRRLPDKLQLTFAPNGLITKISHVRRFDGESQSTVCTHFKYERGGPKKTWLLAQRTRETKDVAARKKEGANMRRVKQFFKYRNYKGLVLCSGLKLERERKTTFDGHTRYHRHKEIENWKFRSVNGKSVGLGRLVKKFW